MREYRIFKTLLGYSIYRRKEEGKLLTVEFLNGHKERTPNKSVAKTFYHKDDAISALTILKHRDERKESD